MNKYIKFFVNSRYRTLVLTTRGFYNRLDDKSFLDKRFYSVFGRTIDWDNPLTFNEKLQWLKIYDRNPDYTKMVDKAAVKEYVAGIIGEEYIIPTLGMFDSFDEIDFDKLPEQFVIKCTHDSGGVIVCTDKSQLDLRKAKKKIEKNLSHNYFYPNREWPYKNVTPKIIIEKYMEDDTCEELTDYKFMCFNGIARNILVVSERYSDSGLKINFFDREWNELPFEYHYPKSTKQIPKPVNLEKMIQLAEKLSAGIPFVRVDFYEVQSKVYFGELTFFTGSGFLEFTPEKWDAILGEMLELPNVNNV